MTIQQLPPLSNAGLYNACEGSLYYIVPSASENLCINPSFEFDTTSWASTGTISRVVSGYSGYYALQAILTANQTVTYTLTRNPTAVQHAASIYVLNSGSIAVTINVQVVDTSTIANRSYTIPANQWTRVQVSFIGRNASTVFRIVASSSCTLRLDACQIEISSNGATTYFDGDTSGTQQSTQIANPQYGWYGNQHSSTSFRNRQATNGGIIVDLQSYGFQLISINGTGNPTFDNQIATFASTDGGILQDTVVPTREIAFLGRISGSTKTELHQRLQSFMALFQRDQVSYYQTRSWKFQHKSGRENIGQEISFSAVLVSAVSTNITDQLSVDVTIQLNMTDPYFYGHDVSIQIPPEYFYRTDANPSSQQGFDWLPTFQNNNQTDNASSLPFRYILGNVYCVYCAPDGYVYVSYENTTIYDKQTATTYNFAHIAKFSPSEQKWYPVTAGNIFSTVASPRINAIVMTLNREYLLIGSNASGGPLSLNSLIVVTVSTGAYTVLGTFNGEVRCIVNELISKPTLPYGNIIYVGGSFTTINGTARSKVAYYSSVWASLTPDVYNGDVYSMAYDNSDDGTGLDYLVISGTFTTVGAITSRRIIIFDLYGTFPIGTYYATSVGLSDYAVSIKRVSYKRYLISGAFNATQVQSTGAFISYNSGLLEITNWNPPTSYGTFTDRGVLVSTVKGNHGPMVIKNNVLYSVFRNLSGADVSNSYITTININDLYAGNFTRLLPVNTMFIDVDDSGNVFFGQVYNARYSRYSKPINFTNTGTASASLAFRFKPVTYPSSDKLQEIGNFTNKRKITFLSGYTTKSISDSVLFGPMPMNKMPVEIDSSDGSYTNITSGEYTYSLVNVVLSPSSDLYTLTVLPGVNVIYAMLDEPASNSVYTTNNEVTFKYTQTYQSLFDGINAV
jgi:hypothetical protein